MVMPLNKESTLSFVGKVWDDDIVPRIEEYIRVPNQSPAFDKEWESNGYMDAAMDIIVKWVEKQKPVMPGMTYKLLKDQGKTPFLLIEIPAKGKEGVVLMYGHMDKQPPLLPWAEGLGPYDPVIRDGLLYGRGGADDGYAAFAAVAAVQALDKQNIPYPRTVIVIEACEESGSDDLPYWIDKVKGDLGEVDLVICLDSGALNYEQMWLTNSLRGMISVQLKVSLLAEGIHSGVGTGIVPSSFRILRQLLSRIEDEKSGDILIKEFHVDIPDHVRQEFEIIKTLGEDVMYRDLPLNKGTKPCNGNCVDLALANTWKPTLAYTGIDGIPPLEKAGNVLRPQTTLALSFRLPPTADPNVAYKALEKVITENVPHDAQVELTNKGFCKGWAAPKLAPWLQESVSKASTNYFGKPFGPIGLGGSIPFMGMLGERFPKAQFVITGVLGPKSNAHGPNEFLHIDFGKKINCCVASILADHQISA